MVDAMDLTGTYDELVEDMQEYVESVESFEDRVQEYRETVRAHEDGDASDGELVSAMTDVAEAMEELDEYRREARSGVEDVQAYIAVAEDAGDYGAIVTEATLAYERLREEMDGEEPEAVDGLEAITALYNTAEERHDHLEDAAYDMEGYLEEAIGTTIVDERWEDDDPLEDASLQQLAETAIAEERQQNPNDLRMPEIVGNDYDDIDEARESVREKDPAGFYNGGSDSYVGPTEDEFAAIGERVAQAREAVQEKDDIRGIW
jgi:uncharacterized coiled-coil DUF342 family protein